MLQHMPKCDEVITIPVLLDELVIEQANGKVRLRKRWVRTRLEMQPAALGAACARLQHHGRDIGV